jgi:formylmethanofuran dehydrogenase subunit C
MSALTTFALKHAPDLRVDMRGITPAAVAGLSVDEVARLLVNHGQQRLPLGEWFAVSQTASDAPVAEMRFDGDLSRFDRIGWQMDSGRIVVEGSVGDYVGGAMSGGELRASGSAGDLAACEMSGGLLCVDGDVGDFAASTLPGSMDGMRGGTLVVRGSAGDRFGDRMRRGSALVFGDAGDFLASRMVAGTIAIGGQAGAHVGFGMRRGSVVFAYAGGLARVPDTFVPAGAEAAVIWQLLSRDLARHGGPFADLPARTIRRHLGDVAAGGKGELILAC